MTLTKSARGVDRDDVRRLVLAAALFAAIAVPAGAQSGSSWERHRGEGFSVELPSTWVDEKDRAKLIREIRRLAGDEPTLAAMIEGLLAAGNGNVAVKMIAFDLAPSSLRSGFATNLNVVAERTALPLAQWRAQALKALLEVDFVVQPVWWRAVTLPAGKAVRLTYRARFALGGKRLDTAITQYALVRDGAATILTYTTLPKLSKSYRATFERSARSFRFR
jgi:hypothetical protein